jgi:hypothetical protein
VASLSPANNQMKGRASDVTGGDPARLADSVVLCARSDLEEDRCARVADCVCAVSLWV